MIARVELFGRHPGEDRFPVIVEIGNPYCATENPSEWACPISVTPFRTDLHDMHGSDSLQALCLAIGLALKLLDGFRVDGGRLEFDDGEEFPLESYSFSFKISAEQ
ncbi:MAG: hypothetical protein JO208_02430 [Alphaproteobacteria bacterium]|nr:hypothetical protein [Alphaproteobacteria bacterium]